MTSMIDFFQLVAQNIWLYGGSFLVILGILVFVHEWGHYIVARMCGVRVEVFSIGFGKEIWGFNDRQGTRWKISLVPLGGYVKMFGDVDPASTRHAEGIEDAHGEIRPLTPEERKVAFFSKSVGQRAAIVVAGPAINFIFAIIVLAGLFMFYGQPVTSPTAVAVIGGSAADEAGFKPHDRVLAINGEEVSRFEDIRRVVTIALDTPLEFTVLRDGQEMRLTATPKRLELEDRFGFKHAQGMLGILGPSNGLGIDNIRGVNGKTYDGREAIRQALIEGLGKPMTITMAPAQEGGAADTLTVYPLKELNQGLLDPASADFGVLVMADRLGVDFTKYGPIKAVSRAIGETWSITQGTLDAMGQMITGTRSASELGGVIRIGAIAGDMAKLGFVALITFTALLSINLGLINLFPIPMLDGGHLLFYFFELLKGSPIPDHVQEYAFRFGLALLVFIMAFANLNDIVHLIL